MFKRSAVFMLCSIGIASTNVVLADDFIISSAVTTTNGGDTLDGNDTITVTGDGSVTTTAANGYGLLSTGDSNTLTNNGELTTGGNDAFAIRVVSGNGNSAINNGSITTSGINAHGIYSASTTNTTIINTGSISTSSLSSHGIFGLSDSFTISNTGTITVSGTDAHGIFTSGNSNTVANSGTITVSGTNAQGIFTSGNSNTVANSGTITVSGTITPSGTNADGIFTNGDSNTVTNSGTVISENGFSISMTGSNVTLNLEQGSVLVGDVNFDNTNATLNINTGSSAVIQMDSSSETPDTINVQSGVYAVSDSTIYVAELSDYAAQDRVLSTQTRLVHNAVADRDSNEEGRWNTVSATILNDSGNDSFSGYDGVLFSASLGLDRANKPSIFAGLSIDQIEGEDNFETDSLSAHLGMYDVWREADYILLAGLSYHNTTREQTNNTVSTGKEDASSNYVSLFVSPSLSYSNLLLEGDLLRLRYTGAYNSSHDFDFAEGDLTVEGRLTHQVEVRLAMQNTVADAQLQYGADIGYIDGNIDVTLAGNNVSGSTPADESYSRLFLSMNVGNSQFNAGYSTSKELSLAFAQSF